MKSPVVKRSIVIAGHKTSVSLEDAFWKGLKEIAGGRDITLSDLVAAIDSERQHGNLSSAIRLFVLDHYRSQRSHGKAKKRGTRRTDRGAPRLRCRRPICPAENIECGGAYSAPGRGATGGGAAGPFLVARGVRAPGAGRIRLAAVTPDGGSAAASRRGV